MWSLFVKEFAGGGPFTLHVNVTTVTELPTQSEDIL